MTTMRCIVKSKKRATDARAAAGGAAHALRDVDVDVDAEKCSMCDHPMDHTCINGKLNSMNMVQCDRCTSWFHWNCVGVTASVNLREWSCKRCK
jgi:hypothetical protein